VSTTGSGFASLSGLPDVSGGKVGAGGGIVVSGGTVDDDDVDEVVWTGAVVVVATVEGTMVVSGTEVDVSVTVVSTGGCVSGGGGGGAGATEEVVEVEVEEVVDESVVVVGSTVVDGSGNDVSVVVVVADTSVPHQDRESSNQRSQSAGRVNPKIGSSDSTRTVVSQHDPSTGWVNVSPLAS